MNALKVIRFAAWGAVVIVVGIAVTIFAFDQMEDPPVALIATVGGPFTLKDQHGETVTEAALEGHPTAIFFGYTFCPDVCPTTLFELTSYLEELGPDGDKLKVYFVTVDPERDTEAVLADYLQAFDPRIVGLTGTREEIDKTLKAYRVFSRKVERDDGNYLMDHTAAVFLLDEDAAFTSTIDYQEDAETAMTKLRRLIDGA